VLAAARGVSGVIKPLVWDVVWLALGTDRPVAALALPFLSGGDLSALIARAARAGQVGESLALEVARPIAETLRSLLLDLEQPLVHGDLRAQHLLLAVPDATPAQLTLIDFDAAQPADPRQPEAAALLADEVRRFGELLVYAATADPHAGSVGSSRRPFATLVRRCLGNDRRPYTSMADPRLWQDLASAESTPNANPLVRAFDALRQRS
jgi:hypothetical protein